MKDRLVIGTRASALALWQTEYVAAQLRAQLHGLEVEVRRIETRGDQVRDRALSLVGGKGLFVKEIEEALLAGEVDLAVHSLKDMPTEQPPGLLLAAILERADPRDALVSRQGTGGLAALPTGARVGTSSLRRRAQLLAARPDLQVADLRGNVDTRLHKLYAGEYEAIILAVAGLARLGHDEAFDQALAPEVMLPAVGQGALCVEVRVEDAATRARLAPLDHSPTRQATVAERAPTDRWTANTCGCGAWWPRRMAGKRCATRSTARRRRRSGWAWPWRRSCWLRARAGSWTRCGGHDERTRVFDRRRAGRPRPADAAWRRGLGRRRRGGL